MPVIVAFGNSNTWGYDPATGARFPRARRWPSVMQRELGADFEVIAEGLNGRTTVHDDPIEPFRSGADALPPCLMSHEPVDLVILALGCNDLKKRFSVSAFDIAEGAARLIFLARAYGVGPDGRPPKILLVAPPPLAKLTGFKEMFEGGAEKSLLLGARYRERRRARGGRVHGRRRRHSMLAARRHTLRSRSARTARARHGGGGAQRARLGRSVAPLSASRRGRRQLNAPSEVAAADVDAAPPYAIVGIAAQSIGLMNVVGVTIWIGRVPEILGSWPGGSLLAASAVRLGMFRCSV